MQQNLEGKITKYMSLGGETKQIWRPKHVYFRLPLESFEKSSSSVKNTELQTKYKSNSKNQ